MPEDVREAAIEMLANLESWIRHTDEARYRLFPSDNDITDEQALAVVSWLAKIADQAYKSEFRPLPAGSSMGYTHTVAGDHYILHIGEAVIPFDERHNWALEQIWAALGQPASPYDVLKGVTLSDEAQVSGAYELKGAELDAFMGSLAEQGDELLRTTPARALPPALRKLKARMEAGEITLNFPPEVEASTQPGADPQPLIDYLNHPALQPGFVERTMAGQFDQAQPAKEEKE